MNSGASNSPNLALNSTHGLTEKSRFWGGEEWGVNRGREREAATHVQGDSVRRFDGIDFDVTQ